MEINKLDFSYNDYMIFENLNLSFSHGLNVVMGVNGSGKSTLLDIIGGLHSERYGMNSCELNDFPKEKNIGYLMQKNIFFPTLTVKQTLNIYKEIGTIDKRVFSQNKDFDEFIMPIANKKMGDLSGGEARIVLIYCQSLLNKKLYLFDEPFSGVDEVHVKMIFRLINTITEKHDKDVILSMHQSEYLKDLQPHLVVIGNKHCIFNGNYEELSLNDDVMNNTSVMK